MAFAPAAPAAGELLVSLGLFVAFIVAFGLLYVYRSTLGLILVGLANTLDHALVQIPFGRKLHLFGPISAALRYADREIDAGLGWAVVNTERGATMLFHLAAHQLDSIGRTIGGFAYDVEHALTRTVTVTIPRVTLAAERRAAQRVATLAAQVGALEGDASRLIRRRFRALEATMAAAGAAVAAGLVAVRHAITVTVPHELDWLRARVRRGERTAADHLARIKGIERVFAGATFAAFVAVALGRLGLRWVRCPRVGRVGKAVCGMDHDLLDGLLADALIIAGTVSLVEFARGMQGVVAEVEAPIRRFWRAA